MSSSIRKRARNLEIIEMDITSAISARPELIALAAERRKSRVDLDYANSLTLPMPNFNCSMLSSSSSITSLYMKQQFPAERSISPSQASPARCRRR